MWRVPGAVSLVVRVTTRMRMAVSFTRMRITFLRTRTRTTALGSHLVANELPLWTTIIGSTENATR